MSAPARARRRPGAVTRVLGVLAATAATVTAYVVLGLIDRELAEVGGVPGLSGGATSAAGPWALVDPERSVAITAAWVRGSDPVSGLPARDLVSDYVLLDVVLACGIAAGLWRLSTLPAGRSAVRDLPRWRRRAVRTRGVAVVYLVSDWAETVGLWRSWTGGDPAAMRWIGAFSLVKWLALGWVVLVLATTAVRAWRTRRRTTRGRMVVLREEPTSRRLERSP